MNPENMVNKLWGDHFFSTKEKKWCKEEKKECQRGFSLFVLDPIYKLFDYTMNKPKEKALELVDTLQIKLTTEEKEMEREKLMKVKFVRN